MRTPSFGIDQNKDGKFVDRYIGRVPKFIHWIPENNICEVNEDYIALIDLVLDPAFIPNNISEELYREVLDFIDRMCNPCAMNKQDQALMRAYEGNEPCPEVSNFLTCGDLICCNTTLSCVGDFECLPVVP